MKELRNKFDKEAVFTDLEKAKIIIIQKIIRLVKETNIQVVIMKNIVRTMKNTKKK